MPHIPELKALYDLGFKPRKGQLVMIYGQSGMGKSAFGMWLAAKWNLPTLYFSADMSSRDASTRLAAIATGHTLDQVAEAADEDGPGLAYYTDALAGTQIQFNCQSPPSMDDMWEEVSAYVDLWDEYPSVIVIDNLKNFADEDDYKELQFIMGELHTLTRITGAHVLVMHHATESTGNAAYAVPPRKDIKFKLSELPDICLGVAANGETGTTLVGVTKQRQGKSDITGKSHAELRGDLARCSFFPVQAQGMQAAVSKFWSEVE